MTVKELLRYRRIDFIRQGYEPTGAFRRILDVKNWDGTLSQAYVLHDKGSDMMMRVDVNVDAATDKVLGSFVDVFELGGE